MAAAASKAVIAATMLLASGCRADRDATRLSEEYGVCASLPLGASFHDNKHGPDFDLGILEMDGVIIEVMIGGHPRFSHRVIKKGVEATDGFRFLGKERSDDRDKILLGYQRGDKEGPIFVMFSAQDLHAAESVLTRKNFVVECK